MGNPSNPIELDRLLAHLVGGEATAEDIAALEKLLDGNADAQRRYVHYLDLHAELLSRSDVADAIPSSVGTDDNAASAIRHRLTKTLVMFAALAAVLLVALGLGIGRWMAQPPGDGGFARNNVDESSTRPVINDLGVAVLTRVSNLVGKRSADLVAGKTIPPGVIQWDAGLLQLEFYSGATVVVEGPAEIEILDESRVVCRSGRLRAHVPEPARGFAVLAPTFELVDLGTEFGMNVTDDGAAEVHVFDGTVELYDAKSNRDVATRRELNAGNALTVDRDGTSKPIAVRDADFVTSTLLSQMADTRQQAQLRDWRAFRDSLRDDPRVVAYFPFDRTDAEDRVLIGYGANGSRLDGAIVGCEWSEGRWPDKTSLQFKRPGDRVRISVPGEFESLTFSIWLRVDGLDREFNSLLLTDGFLPSAMHWQIHQDGALVLGTKNSVEGKYNYETESIFNLFRLGQWVHLATVYDNDNSRVTHYVNGQLTAREPLREAASGLLKIGNATIGNWSLPSDRNPRNEAQRARRVRNFNGCMDELIVFGQALDDQEVRRIYEVGRP